MPKSLTMHRFIFLCCLGCFSLFASCGKQSDSASADATTSLVPVPGTTNESDAEKRAYKPLKWEIKWESRRVLDFDKDFNKVCKTEFINPYQKTIKQIKVGYEVKYKGEEEPVVYEKVIELNLKPHEKKIVDTGIGCRDFYMYEVVFEDGEII